VELVGRATDAAGNVGTATDTLLVLDPSDTEAPEVEITSPEADAIVTAPVDVVGTVNDDNLLSWTLEVAPAAGGPASPINGAAQWSTASSAASTSGLANGSYVLR
jgi:hypothetical protein